MANLQDDILSASAIIIKGNNKLDYSPESLEIVENMLSEASDYINEMPPDKVDNMVQNFGCYILEVGRRDAGGRFAWAEKYSQPVLVVGEPEYSIAIMTWDKVRGRLKGDTGDNIPFFYKGFTESIQKARPGTNILYV